jgi:hypothetical protein
VLRVSDSGRYLERSDGVPFFWMADVAWSLYRLAPYEVQRYMAVRAAMGFTVIQGPVVLGSSDQTDYAGRVNDDPASLNAAWMKHIDFIVDAAARHGLYVAPVLMWGTWNQQITAEQAAAYGDAIGRRYAGARNIAAFIVAGESNYPSDNDPAIWDAVAEALARADGGGHLITTHPKWFGGLNGQSSGGWFHDASWLDLNLIQSSLFGDCSNQRDHPHYAGVHNWLIVENDYQRLPAKPTLDAEATFEQAQPPGTYPNQTCDVDQPRWDDFGVRRRAYWSVFAGGCGHGYGANGVFQFHKIDDPNPVWAPLHTWDVAIDYPGGWQMGHLRRLVESRPMEQRIPGQDLLLTDPELDVPTHVHATRDEGGRFAFVYVPEPARAIVIDTSLLRGEIARGWWFDPRSGEASVIGQFPLGGALPFCTPAHGQDWVLVIDDVPEGFPPPGAPASRSGVLDSSEAARLPIWR